MVKCKMFVAVDIGNYYHDATSPLVALIQTLNKTVSVYSISESNLELDAIVGACGASWVVRSMPRGCSG